MEDDDEFGDLYTDVLRPFTASFQQQTDATGNSAPPSSHSRPIVLNTNSDDDDEAILYGASDSKNPSPNPAGFNLSVTVEEPTVPEFDLNLDLTPEGLVGNEGRGLELEVGDLEKDEGGVEPQRKHSNLIEGDGKDDNFMDNNKDVYNYAAQDIVKESKMGSEQMIPGISVKLDNSRSSNFEDEWDSEESEDDLQIVLNDDNDHGQLGLQGVGDDDAEEEEALAIVADNGDDRNQQMMMGEQQWGGEEGGISADVMKSSGAGGAAVQAALQPKVGYINHAYHQSQFKYVRPGAVPVPGAAPVGIQGHVRPPFPVGPFAGRGRGDWRPAGMKGDNMPMQKGFHPGFGPTRIGLDFTLPSHKTVFEVDIDSFEEKPWKLPGIDMSDFFNFGLNEESWKDYRKQLEQLRFGTTMQNKIRVYESGRAEQDYDPDLPPELAAAVGNQDHISSENANPRSLNSVPTDSSIVQGRPPPPMGRPIPVEISPGDRLPSIDTRRQRMNDTDAIIEVVCHSSKDDEDNVSNEVDIGGADDHQHDNDIEHDSRAHNNGRKRETVAKRGHSEHSSPEITERQQRDGEIGDHPRSAKGRELVRSPKTSARDDKRREKSMDNEDEESLDSRNSKQSHSLSSPRAIGCDGEQNVIARDHNKSDGSSDMVQEKVVVDESTFDEDKQKLTSQENSKDSRSGGNSKSRSGNSKDNLKFRDSEDEVLQSRRPPRAGNAKIAVQDAEYARKRGHHERDVTGRKHMSAKGREDSYPCESGDPNFLLRRHVKGESGNWRKESDMSEGNWHWRDEDRHGKFNRVQESRKTDHGGEIGSRNRIKVRESEITAKEEDHQSRSMMDSGSWRDRDTGSKQRGRDQSVKSRSGKADDIQNKKRKDGEYVSREHVPKEDISHSHRETSSRRKRNREDVSDQWKRDGSLQRERNDRERERDEWHRLQPTPEEILSRRDREETRPMMRSGRVTEEKAWNSHSRRKDEYRGSSKEYHPNDHINIRDRVERESFSQNRGREDIYAHGNQPGHDENRARYERPGSRNDRAPNAYDNSRVHEYKQKESRRKGKDSESVGHSSSLVASKRNTDEKVGQTSQMVNSRGRSERRSGENETLTNRQFPKKQRKDDASSDEEHSKRGRSKLERWTSNKERDFTTTTSVPSSTLKNNKDSDTIPNNEPPLVNGLHVEPPEKVEDKPQHSVDDKDATGTESVNPKVMEDKHLDTVEKLKKRSERFKLPMPIEKDTLAMKKMENEPFPSAQPEIGPVSEIKPERPARKRRWTGN